MKKYLIIFLLIILVFPISAYASKTKVKLDKCIDGDTISVITNKEEKKVRFLAVDAPEIDKNEPYSKEAKDFTCNMVSSAKHIYLEYDKNSDKEDKYERLLAWVWADDILVQKELIKEGYARLAYLYNDYKYTSELNKFESYAKNSNKNIWGDYKEEIKPTPSKKKKILFTHGGGFHWEVPDHFRIVYLPNKDVLEKAAEEMKDFLKDYKQVC